MLWGWGCCALHFYLLCALPVLCASVMFDSTGKIHCKDVCALNVLCASMMFDSTSTIHCGDVCASPPTCVLSLGMVLYSCTSRFWMGITWSSTPAPPIFTRAAPSTTHTHQSEAAQGWHVALWHSIKALHNGPLPSKQHTAEMQHLPKSQNRHTAVIKKEP